MDNTSKMNNELDQYGVWVKTPPHNAQFASNENTPDHQSESVPVQEKTEKSDDENDTETSDVDLEEFGINDSVPAEDDESEEVRDADFSMPEDLFSDDLTLPSMPEPELIEENSASDVSEPFEGAEPDASEVASGSFESESVLPHEADVSVSEPVSESTSVSDSSSSDGSADDFDFEALAESISESEGPSSALPEKKEVPVSDLADGEISLDAFLGDGDSSSDGFLGSDTNMQPDGDISLDAFLDSSDFGLGPEKQESAAESFEEPLDIDLTFEDSALEFDDGSDVDFSDLDSFLEDAESSGDVDVSMLSSS